MEQINTIEQRLVVYKINPNEHELSGEVIFDRNADGRTLHGDFFIHDHCLIVKNEDGIIQGVFSLHYYYFIYLR